MSERSEYEHCMERLVNTVGKETVIEALKKAKHEQPFPQQGVCSNATEHLRDMMRHADPETYENFYASDMYDVVKTAAVTWPHTMVNEDGIPDYDYPVPHDSRYGKWSGTNLEYRLELIDHTIKYVEDFEAA